MLRRIGFVVLAATLVAGACSGDDDDDAGGDEQEEVSVADDQQRADAAIAAVQERLEAEGFTAAAADDEEDDFEFESAECQEFAAAFPGDDESLPGETASAESDDFERGEMSFDTGVETVGAMVGFVEDPETIDELLSVFDDELLERCIEEAFRAGFEEAAAEDDVDVEVSDLDVSPVPEVDVGDESAGVRMTGSFSTMGFDFEFAFDIQMVRVGRAAVGLMVTAIGTDSSVDRASLLQLMVDEVA